MSLVIFFGFAFCVFAAGLTVVSITVYQWVKLKKENKELPSWTKSELASKKASTENSL